ncbi:MAG TPA: diguanylate cyclase [Solirubrobacteraceae bacterium]|nr:diguanylate cyclase [Solirubrobacteraceae bacterium]
MTDAVVSEFARICAQRFVSLGDAVRSVLSLLESQVPDGRVIFGELNYNTDEYRVLDARGDGIDVLGPGARLPLQESFCVHMAGDEAPALVGRASKDPVYGKLELQKTARVESYVAAPVELGDGTRVASVCAMSKQRDRYDWRQRDLMTIAARLIAYEWERVTRESKLRQLAQQQRALTGDPLTGLPMREAFLEALDREWHLSHRGITESYVLVVKPRGIEEVRTTSGNAVADLLLQSTGEVIATDVRRSDIAGRVGEHSFGAILVGCNGIEGAEAFLARLQGSFERKLGHRPERLELVSGIERLSDTDSAEAALTAAEAALSDVAAVEGAPS